MRGEKWEEKEKREEKGRERGDDRGNKRWEGGGGEGRREKERR